MNITKEQKIVFYKAAIAIIDDHEPCLESYLRDYLPRVIHHRSEDATFEKVMATIPPINQVPRLMTRSKGHYSDLRKYYQEKLNELVELSKPSVLLKDSPSMPPLSPPPPPKKNKKSKKASK
jgi:hypothetical protein